MSNLSWGDKLPAEAEQKEFSLPPIGEYNFMVASVEKTYAKNSGAPMAKVRLALQGADGSVFDNLLLQDNMTWKLNSFFESIGVKQKGKELDISLADAFDMATGKEGRLLIKHEMYNGEARARVNKYITPVAKTAPTSPVAPIDDMPFEI